MKRNIKVLLVSVISCILVVTMGAMIALATCSESNEWSAWSEEKPVQTQGMKVEEKTGYYKYQTKETTTSTDASLQDGWIKSGSSESYSSYGDWSGWSLTAQTKTDTKNVETRTVYYYYHYCDGKSNFAPSTKYTFGKYGPHTLYSTKKLTVDRTSAETGLSIVDGEAKCEKGLGSYYYGGTKTQYRYQTRTKTTVYSYYRLSAPVLCSQSDITNGKEAVASSTTETMRVTLYRYKNTAHVFSGAPEIESMPTCSKPGVQYQICTVCGERVETVIPKTDHIFSNEWTTDVKETCTSTGVKSHHCVICGTRKDITIVPARGHSFVGNWYTKQQATCTTNGLQYQLCSVCGKSGNESYIAPVGHKYERIVTPSSLASNGNAMERCSACGDIKSSQTIARIDEVQLDKTTFTYSGKAVKPQVTVKDIEGRVLVRNQDYKLKYSSGRKECGTYKVKVTFIGNYTGTKTVSFKIKLGKVTGLKQLKKPGIYLKWNQVIGATRYQVQTYNKTTKEWVPLGKKGEISTNQYFNTSIRNVTMKIRVRAVRDSGVGAWASITAKARSK